jgi:hypothetical protein
MSTSWLSPSATVWEAKFGKGSFPYGMAGRALKPLGRAGWTPEEIAVRLEHYLKRLDNPQFVSLWKFAATFGMWEAPNDTKPTAREPEYEVDADGVLVRRGMA